jgi:hypothetical protein
MCSPGKSGFITSNMQASSGNSIFAVTFHRHYRDSRLSRSHTPRSYESTCSCKSLISRNFVKCAARPSVSGLLAIRLHFGRGGV